MARIRILECSSYGKHDLGNGDYEQRIFRTSAMAGHTSILGYFPVCCLYQHSRQLGAAQI